MTLPHPSSRDERLPARMRDYRIEAEPCESPDLHQLAQLFIGIALARAEKDRVHHAPPPDPRGSGPVGGGEVESDQQKANG